jgi:hypothetical protein
MDALKARHIQVADNTSYYVPHWGYVDRVLPCTNDAGSCEYLDAVYVCNTLFPTNVSSENPHCDVTLPPKMRFSPQRLIGFSGCMMSPCYTHSSYGPS